MAAPEKRPELCRHCGDAIPAARWRAGDAFCCAGCAAVHAFLAECRLDRDYYALRGPAAPGRSKPFAPSEGGDDFSALDEAPFRHSAGEAALDFFVEGVHCAACVWILERLPEMVPGVAAARLDAGRALLSVAVRPEGRFAAVAETLVRLGYRVHPVRGAREAEERLARADRATVKRIGVAAFSAMNVMLYSVALYAGVTGGYATLFRWLSVALALPALTYSAWPFYGSAYRALRGKRISIDLPIALAFVGGFAESLRQIFLGTNLVYLDSVTSLVFLMLLSRYALARLERAETAKAGLLGSLLPARAFRVDSAGRIEEVRVAALGIGDRVRLRAGERIGFDGNLETGSGALDLSFLSGETKPVPVAVGDRIYAGARVLNGEFVARVAAKGAETRLGGIEARLERVSPRANARTEVADRIAQAFLAVVLGLALTLFFAFGSEHLDEAIRRSLSLLIVACPCALALATPLTLARAFRAAAARGVVVRDLDAFDRAAKADRVVFDKTGTLTTGNPEVAEWIWADGVSGSEREEFASIAYSAETVAKHPYARAIVRYLENLPGVWLCDSLEVGESPRRGVRAAWGGRLFTLEAASDEAGVEFRRDGVLLARIHFRESVRPEAERTVARLRAQGLGIEVLSGDSEPAVEAVARRIGADEWTARATPESKAEVVADPRHRGAIMVGDGVNDAVALGRAAVGFAFARGDGEPVETLLASSAVAAIRGELAAVADFVDVARRYRRTLARNAAISVAYNFAGATLAVLGFVHPLVAAIAMPVSALTVFLSTGLGLRVHERERTAK